MNQTSEKQPLKLLISIVDPPKSKMLKEIFNARQLHLHFSFRGKGTATSELLDILGLGNTDKSILVCLAPETQMMLLLNSLRDNLNLEIAGGGIAFVLPLSGLCLPDKSRMGGETFIESMERWNAKMELHSEVSANNADNDLILAIVNHGYSDSVVDAAKEAGAQGGTVINARGADIKTPVKFFEVSIQPEKEIVMLLVSRQSKQNILNALNPYCGKDKEAKGVVFTLPVEEVVGNEKK